jgi:hypothetical protein
MSSTPLNLRDMRDHAGADIKRYATKTEAAAALRPLKLGAEVRPERADRRFARVWVNAVEPVGGGRSEGRVLLTEQGGWLIICAADCIDRHRNPDAPRECPGHPMSAEESHDFTIVLVGHHRTEVISIGLDRKVRLTDGTYVWNPAGTLYRARCMDCPWKSSRIEEHSYASRAAREHSATH